MYAVSMIDNFIITDCHTCQAKPTNKKTTGIKEDTCPNLGNNLRNTDMCDAVRVVHHVVVVVDFVVVVVIVAVRSTPISILVL